MGKNAKSNNLNLNFSPQNYNNFKGNYTNKNYYSKEEKDKEKERDKYLENETTKTTKYNSNINTGNTNNTNNINNSNNIQNYTSNSLKINVSKPSHNTPKKEDISSIYSANSKISNNYTTSFNNSKNDYSGYTGSKNTDSYRANTQITSENININHNLSNPNNTHNHNTHNTNTNHLNNINNHIQLNTDTGLTKNKKKLMGDSPKIKNNMNTMNTMNNMKINNKPINNINALNSILDKDKFITSNDESNFTLNHYNCHTKIKKFENAKFGMKPNGVITSYGANTHQGLYRNYNEDRVSIILNVLKPNSRANEEWPKVSFFAVYDGHGGNKCADFLKENLHQYVCG